MKLTLFCLISDDKITNVDIYNVAAAGVLTNCQMCALYFIGILCCSIFTLGEAVRLETC